MASLGFYLYLAFMCSWFLHLPTRYPVLGAIRADLLLVCLIGALCSLSRMGQPEAAGDTRTRKLLWSLMIYALVTIPLVEWPGSVIKVGFPQFLKAFVFFFFTATLVTTPARLRTTLVVFVACGTFRVLEPLYLHVTEGYWGSVASMSDWENMNRLAGAPDDVVNPNGLAFIILTVIPFLHYLTSGSTWGRLIYVSTLPCLLYALILTGSRSGMIGLTAFAALAWLKSRHKLVFAATAAVAIAAALPHLSDDMRDRYQSIVSSHTKNSGTVEYRMEGLRKSLQVTMHRPLFGHGLGTSREANYNFGAYDQPAHNLYIEVSQELGVVGLVIFLLFIQSVLRGLKDARRALRDDAQAAPVLHALVPALQVFLGMNLLFSVASYGLSGYEWYLTAGLTDVIARLASKREHRPVERVASAISVRANHALVPAALRVR